MAANPLFILVMRHAEKPADVEDPNLSPPGDARAASISKHSARPYETVKPLSKHTGVPINSTIADQDYSALAAELLTDDTYAGKRVVVCWHHGNIPSLMHALGAPAGSFRDPWDPAVFNLILKVEFSAGAATVSPVIEPF
jgi:hypothetical protein